MTEQGGEALYQVAVRALCEFTAKLRESEINQEGKARKLWDIEEGKGI